MATEVKLTLDIPEMKSLIAEMGRLSTLIESMVDDPPLHSSPSRDHSRTSVTVLPTPTPTPAPVAPTPTPTPPTPTPIPTPTPAPVAPTPTPTPAPVAPTPTGPPDTQNMPWDARIHASSHNVIGDGTWRKKRGISSEYFTLVKNELLGLVPPPIAETATPPVAPAHDFTSIMTLAATKGVTLEQLNLICVAQGLLNSGELAARPDLHGSVYDLVFAYHGDDGIPF